MSSRALRKLKGGYFIVLYIFKYIKRAFLEVSVNLLSIFSSLLSVLLTPVVRLGLISMVSGLMALTICCT